MLNLILGALQLGAGAYSSYKQNKAAKSQAAANAINSGQTQPTTYDPWATISQIAGTARTGLNLTEEKSEQEKLLDELNKRKQAYNRRRELIEVA